MDAININRMILDKLEEKDLGPDVKGFIHGILQHEKGGLNQVMPQFTQAYTILLDRYAEHALETERPDGEDLA